MEVIYRAFDGREFTGADAREKCQIYENSLYPLAYDGNGKKTTNPHRSLFVVINNMAELSAFRECSKEKNSPCTGIDGTGHWLWAGRERKYVEVSFPMGSIKGYFKDKEEQSMAEG